MALFEAERHEPLIDVAWDEAAARAYIDRIVDDTNRAFTFEGLWPIHPFDKSPERPADCLKLLYFGAAGVVWALVRIDELGFASLKHDFIPIVATLAARHRKDITSNPALREYMERELPAYLTGETGIQLLDWKLAPSPELERQLAANIEATIGDPRGLAWGGAGAMIAALHLLDRTRDSRWKDLYLRHFNAIWEKWKFNGELKCHLWTFELYGTTETRIGALHGLVANAIAMLRGRHLVPNDRANELMERIATAIRATAVSEDDLVNWPHQIEAGKPGPARIVQHCIGAPGVINGLCGFPKDSRWLIDDLLEAGGELIWRAGPTVKFPVLCHGAAGSGYALLKLHQRTGDPKWLERARRFAMHAIHQADRALEKWGQRKFSLWTGDLGLTVFLANCVRGVSDFPTIDVF